MDSSGIDYHFIMISDQGTGFNQIEVPAPLGTSSRFMHINSKVDSYDLFTKTIECYDSSKDSIFESFYDGCSSYYSTFLRDNAILNIIMITDADARGSVPLHPAGGYLEYDTPSNSFKDEMINSGKGDFTLHGIIGIDPADEIAGLIEEVGQEYIDGISDTSGIQCDITTNTTLWGNLFDQISDNIEEQVSKIYVLDEPPYGVNPLDPETSFTVYVNSIEISSAGNWEYNSSNNTIDFINDTLLSIGDNVDIYYNTIE